jgi:hypothetical protein
MATLRTAEHVFTEQMWRKAHANWKLDNKGLNARRTIARGVLPWLPAGQAFR